MEVSMDESVAKVVCDAEESDWLDVSYTERKYIQPSKKFQFKFGKWAKIAVVAVVCVALFATVLFVDGDFRTEVFQTAKNAYASVFSLFSDDAKLNNTINIPCNLNVVDVKDGVVTFDGGKVATCLAKGTVVEVGQNSVTVALDDKTSIVYGNLSLVLVSANDVVEQGALLGKYDGQLTACILVDGQIVLDVVGSPTQLVWKM